MSEAVSASGGDAGSVVVPEGVADAGDAAGAESPAAPEPTDWEAIARGVVEKEGIAGGGEDEEAASDDSPEAPKQKKPEEKKAPKKPATQEELDTEFERLTAGFSKLTSQERRLKERAEAHTESIRKFEAEKAQAEQQVQSNLAEAKKLHTEVNETLKRAKTNPEEALKLGGWTLDDIAQWILNDGKVSPEKLIADSNKEMQETLRKIQEEKAEALRQFEQEKLDREGKKFEAGVRSYIEQTLSEYRYLSTQPIDEEVYPAVMKYIGAEYKKGNVVAPDAAMRYFEERLSRMATRLTPAPASEGAVPQTAKPAAAKPGNSNHAPITNRDASLRSHRPVEETDDDDIDDDERVRRAVAALG